MIQNPKTAKSFEYRFLIALLLGLFLMGQQDVSAQNHSQDSEVIAQILWIDIKDGLYILNISSFTGEQWVSDELVYSSENPLTSPALGTDHQGNKLVIWTEQILAKTVLKSTSRSVNGNWRLPKIFSDQGHENFSASVVYDQSGNAWVFWSSTLDELSDIYFVRSDGFDWSLPTRVNQQNSVPDIHPRVILTDIGKIEVTWSQYSFENNSYVEEQFVFDDESITLGENVLKDMFSISDIQLPSFLPDNRLSVIHFPQNKMLQSSLISSR
ncbi:MAG: hypothetical protein KTR16_07225 [Acidiferrobacterales bacterium]|nr:hypothetical protein [Acidiferrobacterales bacterium]